MAFTVAPTSGEPPFVFNATFADKASINGVNYGVEFRALSTAGSCPPDALTANNNEQVATALLNIGTYSASAPIPVGSCRTSTLLIRNLNTNDIISSISIPIDNI